MTKTWDDSSKQRLRAHWARGLSAAAIGRLLGISKNAVISKARRLGLPGRPNPILPRQARQEPAPRVTLPPLSVAEPVTLEPEPVPVTVAAPPAPLRPRGRVEPCCWAEPAGRRQWRYCDAVSLPNQPYCEEHAAKARPAVKRRLETGELVAAEEG
jgi:GcrA cell cycle regulator